MKKRKIGRRILIILLSIQAIVELVLGILLLFNFSDTLESAFEITYNSELDILGIALGLYLLLLTALMVLSIVWTRKGNASGAIIGIIVGVFLFIFGLTTFLQLDRTDGLIGDSIRGLITVVFGFMAYKELKAANKLR